MKNLYALIIGIDKYPTSPLSGCVRDAEEIFKFFENDFITAQYKVHPLLLTDEKATREGIITAFENHLGQASENDIAFFHFSGHGAQEAANLSLWHEEPDGKLEGLVCYDSLKTNLLLADKELRFLIQQLALNNPHILTVFDCCHSGENTRGFKESATVTKRQFADPRMGNLFPKRDWEDFCFHKEIDPNKIQGQALNTALPQGNHIQLAACQSDQSAYETTIENWGRGGVFTYTLIKILERSKGIVTYHDLKSRIHHYIKNQFNQSPNIYVKGKNKREIFKTFLGSEQGSQPMYGNVVFNESRNEWVLDMGAMHGISKQAESVKVIVNNKEVIATIKSINPSDTEISIPDSPDQPLERKAYKAYVHPFKSAPIAVFINGDKYEKEAKKDLEKWIQEKGTNINLVEDETVADYSVQLDKWNYTITLPNDPYRPLVLPISKDETDAAERVFNDLYHISQWEFAKSLHNTDSTSRIDAGAVDVTFWDVNNDDKIDIKNDEISVFIHPNKEDNQVKIKLTNTSDVKLHVAMLNLGVNFEVIPDLLEGRVQLLEPNGFVWLTIPNSGHHNIPYYLDPCKAVFNWGKSTSYFKLIFSTHPFDISTLLLDALPDPIQLLETTRGFGTAKGIGINKSKANAERWITKTIAFSVLNPNYNKVDLKLLEAQLKTEAAPFLTGLYLKDADPFAKELVLKEGITEFTEQERGVADTAVKVANWVSKNIRLKRYKKRLKSHPDSIRIVSEGDSWFQYPHPKVLDIIDHLSNHYAIFSAGSAGDELLNYFDEQEYFFAVEKEKPTYFLISGGGNDILGAEFEGYLRDDLHDDLKLEREEDLENFMNAAFFEKLEKVLTTYTKIFDSIFEKFPEMHILVHGYDYIIPLESTTKGWLGRYMIAKNMTSQYNRRRLIKHLLIAFNNKLSALAANYPNVHYIDVRDSVSDTQWYDEIHPTSEGFELVANAFMEKLEELELEKAKGAGS